MDNAAGYLRGDANSLVAGSYRIRLPSSILQGVATRTYDGESEFRFAAGTLGRLTGVLTQELDRVPGQLIGAAYTTRITPNWSAGAQLWSLQGHDTVRDHQSVGWATQYLAPDLSRRLQLHGLNDSTGKYGLWVDGEERYGFWLHRYGVFRLEPKLLWTDAPVAADQQGGLLAR